MQLPQFVIRTTQTGLVVELNQHLDDGAGQVVDVVVAAMPEKPTETEIKEAKGFMSELHRDVLGQLTDPSKLADQLVSHVGDLG